MQHTPPPCQPPGPHTTERGKREGRRSRRCTWGHSRQDRNEDSSPEKYSTQQQQIDDRQGRAGPKGRERVKKRRKGGRKGGREGRGGREGKGGKEGVRARVMREKEKARSRRTGRAREDKNRSVAFTDV